MTSPDPTPHRQVRAQFSESTITVYQAYSSAIADAALTNGRFVSPFKRKRMTWIKPSFLWMAYRSGWATKDGQERVLAIEITREGFEWALANASLSHYEAVTYESHDEWVKAKASSPVRIQWDPERDLQLQPLAHRAIQIGLGGVAVDRYVDDWTVAITDTTELTQQVHQHVRRGELAEASALLPVETPYPIPPWLAARVGAG